MSSHMPHHRHLISQPTQTPVPLPRFPGFTYRGAKPSLVSSPDVLARQAPRDEGPAARPRKLDVPRPPAKSREKGSSHIAVMLQSPAQPRQYQAVDEPEDEDELQVADELVLSDLSPQYKMKTSAARASVARERPKKPPLAHPSTTKIMTPVPPPRAVALSPTVSTPPQGSRTSTPGGVKSGNMGRPKGWKPGMSYADVRNFGPEVAAANAKIDPAKAHEKVRRQRAAAPLPGTQAIPKRRGRPPRPPSPTPRAIYEGLGPRFVPFLCEWRGCKAELHNLETLRRHVRIVHCGKRAPRECRWGMCAEDDTPPAFDSKEALESHVELAHLIPFAWHVGDGPKVSVPGTTPAGDNAEELPGYLFDEEGRQVTPSIRDQQVEDFAAWKERRRQLKALLQEMWEAMPVEAPPGDDDVAGMRTLSVVLDR